MTGESEAVAREEDGGVAAEGAMGGNLLLFISAPLCEDDDLVLKRVKTLIMQSSLMTLVVMKIMIMPW